MGTLGEQKTTPHMEAHFAVTPYPIIRACITRRLPSPSALASQPHDFPHPFHGQIAGEGEGIAPSAPSSPAVSTPRKRVHGSAGSGFTVQSAPGPNIGSKAGRPLSASLSEDPSGGRDFRGLGPANRGKGATPITGRAPCGYRTGCGCPYRCWCRSCVSANRRRAASGRTSSW